MVATPPTPPGSPTNTATRMTSTYSRGTRMSKVRRFIGTPPTVAGPVIEIMPYPGADTSRRDRPTSARQRDVVSGGRDGQPVRAHGELLQAQAEGQLGQAGPDVARRQTAEVRLHDRRGGDRHHRRVPDVDLELATGDGDVGGRRDRHG